MQAVTLLVSVLAILAIFGLRPIYGLCVYAAGLFCYSQRLTVPIFTIDFNYQRIVIGALVLRALMHRESRQAFKLTPLDYLVPLAWLAAFFAYQLNVPLKLCVVREGGRLVDAVLPYFAVRLIIHSRRELMIFIKFMAILAVPLAVAGLIQTFTGYNVAGFMERFYAWRRMQEFGAVGTATMRNGLYRATVTFGNYLAYGMFFPFVAALTLGLWKTKAWPKSIVFVLFAATFGGVFASVSSAPLFAFVIFVGVCCLFPLRRYWVVAVVAGLAMLVFVEVFSNRHFYHVLTRLAMNGATAYYRIQLFDQVVNGGMNGHWLAGYGYVGIGPGNDNTHFFWKQKDLVNLYIHHLARTGLIGLIPFLAINFTFYYRLYVAGHKSRHPPDQWLVWTLGAGMFSVNVALMTVTPLDQIMTMFYMLIGLSNTLPIILAKGSESRAREYLIVLRRVPRTAQAAGTGMELQS